MYHTQVVTYVVSAVCESLAQHPMVYPVSRVIHRRHHDDVYVVHDLAPVPNPNVHL